jgi:hypothetical protein
MYGMEELNSEAGYRSSFEFYQAEEAKFLKLADEMHQRKIEVLGKWREFNRGKSE